MPLIKYYKSNTCYDGKKDFIHTNESSFRNYPDEYIIANILNQYHHKRFRDSKNITVLKEPWLNEVKQPIRTGDINTEQINELIIQEIDLAEKDNKDSLILVPFLYNYHHPGITIDVKNKTAIYLDPYGLKKNYPQPVKDLQELLEKKGFKTLIVTTKQQTDQVSCGPILTASMIKFIVN